MRPTASWRSRIAGDDWRECRDYVRTRLGITDAWKEDRGRAATRFASKPKVEQPDDRIAEAVQLWRESADPWGTDAERYLAGRKLELGDDLAGETLRWHPRIGALLALFRNIETNRPQAVSRTFLDPEARKLKRKFLGPVGGLRSSWTPTAR